jgi:hypothetical protein
MNRSEALAIAASAYNRCGPQSGDPATPRNVLSFGRNSVAHCMAEYARLAESGDDTMYVRASIVEARDFLVG